MSYQEKRTITSITTGLLVLAAYCLYAFNPSRLSTLTSGDLKPWAATMLIFIGIGVVTTIIIQIVFHILLSISIAIKAKMQNMQIDDKEIEKAVEKSIGTEMVEDEMGKMIELKSSKVGMIFAGIGFVGGLFSLILNYSPVVMLNIMFLSFSAGSIFEGFSQIYFYRRGL